MGRNTGGGQRIGAVSSRIQYYNPKTKMYVKFDTENNKIMSCSKNPYKGVRKGDNDKSDKQKDIKVELQDCGESKVKTTKNTK